MLLISIADGGLEVMGMMLPVSVRKDPGLICPGQTPGMAGLAFGLSGCLAGPWEGWGLWRRGLGQAGEVASCRCPTP